MNDDLLILGKSIEEAAHTLASQLSKEFPKAGSFTVGYDQKDTIHVYEHIRGMSHAAPKEYYGFKVIREYWPLHPSGPMEYAIIAERRKRPM